MSKDCTNGGCSCTPNTSIKCTVTNCNNHCQDTQYCGLDEIRVCDGQQQETSCQSFQQR